MKKSATAPLLIRKKNYLFEEDENSRLFRAVSDLRLELNTTMTLLKIEEKEFSKNISMVRFVDVMNIMKDDIDAVLCHSEFIVSSIERYDFKDVKANGYRSFIVIVQRCSTLLLTKLHNVNSQNGVLKWDKSVINEIIAFSECFHELRHCLNILSDLKKLNTESSLIPSPKTCNILEIQRLIDESDKLRQDVFFGQCLGFYYCNSAQRILQVLGSIMSGCAHSFITNQSGFRGVFNTLMKTVTCFWNPENRGQIMAMITRNATVDFTKQFWNLGEHPLVLEAPNMILPPVDVAVNFDLPPIPFTVPTKFSDPSYPSQVTIYPPADGPNNYSTRPIKLRLISLRMRDGLSWINKKTSSVGVSNEKSFIQSFNKKTQICKERSKYLLIHCHGGGFVAQSAKSHDIYLRSWAEQLDCPILSIDYSLAPEYPYPRALEECFYAVSWAIRNRRQLGCTNDAKIVLCGDSAGANLALCSTLKAIKSGLTVPDALFFAYVPALVTMSPSPARLMSSIDPLLPVGILVRCLLAYVGIDEKSLVSSDTGTEKQECSEVLPQKSENLSKENEKSEIRVYLDSINKQSSPLTRLRLAKIPDDPFMSPLLSDDLTLSQLPPTSIITSHFDPLLDDCVELCKRIDKVGVPVTLKVVHDIPHGFLNFVLLSRECELASHECVKMIGQLFEKSVTLKK